MSLAPKIVLQAPLADPSALQPFVEDCLRDGVELIAVVGTGCEALEEAIDWIVIGDGSDGTRFLTTSAHPNESLQNAVSFADAWISRRDGGVQVVAL
ncbi:hypothetical protein [Sphingosinithalassobacter sp. LHW66-3]|uniref:hypothetical protein n=1 Tax=Sphingosinithalassobacter sp. LHW66-3 TaxID=3424718 RepID=UPI003D6B767F